LVSINTNMKYYKNRDGSNTLGRKVKPETWISGDCPIVHDKYYAWLKHRAQARYRGEDYYLSFEDWCELWTPSKWSQRGRKADSLVLQRQRIDGEWSLDNCEVVTRLEQLRRQREYKHLD